MLVWLLLFGALGLLASTDNLSQRAANSDCNIITATSLRSRHVSSEAIEITFTNAGEEPLDIIWIDSSGSEVFISSLEQNEATGFSTFPDHAWRVNLQTSGATNFERILSASDADAVFEVGLGCRKDGFSLNFSQYSFSTTSDIAMVPEPDQLPAQIAKSPCQQIGLSDWINKFVAAPGYHVVCLTRSDEAKDGSWRLSIEGWRDGYLVVNQNSGQTFTGTR
jgi:hypothetical protein